MKRPDSKLMKRAHVLAAVLVAAIAGATAVAEARSTVAPAHASHATEVLLRHTEVGSILTSSAGLTLYEFTRDRGSEDSCVKIHGCARAWPALTASGKPTAGPGVKASLLSSVRIAGGAKQVTYAGHPLYTYSQDTAGSVEYVGVSAFGGYWYALSASGHTVK
jgi:predicted lipoprotein with Yx(FWY)xxD motif